MKRNRAEVILNGQRYRLRFDMYAMEQVEKEFGGIREAFDSMNGKGITTTVRKLFKIMANTQRDFDGMPEDITGDEIGKHTPFAKMQEISEALREAMEDGMHSETTGGGEADDQKHDEILEEIEREEKNG